MGSIRTVDYRKPIELLTPNPIDFEKERAIRDAIAEHDQATAKTAGQAAEIFAHSEPSKESIPVSSWSIFGAAAGTLFQNASSLISGIGNIRSLLLKGWGYVALPVSAWVFWKWCKGQQGNHGKEGVVINNVIHNHAPLDTKQLDAIVEKVVQRLQDEKALRNETEKC